MNRFTVTALLLVSQATQAQPPAAVQSIGLGDRQVDALGRPDWSVSADGTLVVLSSRDPLLPIDRNGLRDIYVFDRRSGQLTLETAGAGAGASDGDSTMPDIDGSGRFVVFISVARNLGVAPVDANLPAVYLRDRWTGTTTFLSGRASHPTISDDGRTVVFESTGACGANEAAGVGGLPHVCLVRVDADAPAFQDVVRTDGPSPGQSVSPAVDATGARVVFTATGDLTARPDGHDTNDVGDVYLWDVVGGHITLVSRAGEGGPANGRSYHPAISADGCHVAFASEATNLVREARSSRPQAYVHDTRTGTTRLVSRTAAGRPGNGASIRPAISRDGRRVAFQSLASDLLGCPHCARAEPDVNLLWDVFLHDLDSSTTRLAAAALDTVSGTHGVVIDRDGVVAVYGSRQPRNAADEREDVDLFIVSAVQNEAARQQVPRRDR